MDLVQAVKSYDYKQFDSPAPIELTEEQLSNLVQELKDYHAIYSPYFGHTAQVEHAYSYLLGLLKPNIERKSAENIALATVGIQGVVVANIPRPKSLEDRGNFRRTSASNRRTAGRCEWRDDSRRQRLRQTRIKLGGGATAMVWRAWQNRQWPSGRLCRL